jgi:hypothetical protein
MGVPDTYDICGVCGEAIRHPNNTGSWVHVETRPAGVPATDCKNPTVRNAILSKSGQSIATHGRAKKRGT